MGVYAPPYINKHADRLAKDVTKAERKALRAQKQYEYANEYLALCKKQYADAKDKK